MTDATRPPSGLNEYQRVLFADRLDGFDADDPGYRQRFEQLEEMLVALGGFAAVPHLEANRQLDELLAAGERFGGAVAIEEGKVSSCHSNSAKLWAAGKADALATGYGLNGGLWREHSWALRRSESAGAWTVVETTTEREAYFGVILLGPGALAFAASELGDDEMWCTEILEHHRDLVQEAVRRPGKSKPLR